LAQRAPTIGVEAIGSADPLVAFSIGSRLVSLQDGVANALLDKLLGANVSLSAVSYNALVDAKVGIFSFLDALAQNLNISAGTYQTVLSAEANQGQVARALADVLTGAQKSAARALAAAMGNGGKLDVGSLFNLGDYAGLSLGSGPANAFASVSALQVLASSAAVSDGSHQAAFNMSAAVPGLASIATTLAVGEPPQFASWLGIGPSGTVTRTAQVRMSFVATLAGGPLLAGATVRVPLYLEVAYGDATLQSATCPVGSAKNGSATVFDAAGGWRG
jgi:uncharacterized membrane protein